MTSTLLDRIERLDLAHARLCDTLARLRRQAWVTQGRPAFVVGPEAFVCLMSTTYTTLMHKVERTIEAVDRKLGEMETAYSQDLDAILAEHDRGIDW